MAARTGKGTKFVPWDKKVRDRIGVSMLVNRLRDHVLGQVELTPTQVRAAEILLRKCMPDLAAVEHTGDVHHHYIVRAPEQIVTPSAWKQQHAPSLPN